MREGAAQLYHMTVRDLRSTLRQPTYVVAALVQPMLWLLLFGQLFTPLMETTPGTAATGSYTVFLTPGVVALTAVFASGWSGVVLVTEMEQGLLNRFLVTPVRRWALIAGRLAQQAIVVLAQAVFVLLIGVSCGARFHGGILILLAFLAAMTLCTIAFASLSNALGLITRSHQTVVAIAQFMVLPLAFLSEIFVPREEMPAWMSAVATVNPVNWLVEIGRQSISEDVEWDDVLGRGCGLLAIALASFWLSTLALRVYQRQV
ncbi:ABC transporter permease [Actinomadura roseirufa]|uniref:ABC transporter permease n=1 Tax=Actinomadura roseirufa TaxID=2094049 RepID=UPI0010413E59|nr:ABC transporter permease [Actinomadura roseirufa]